MTDVLGPCPVCGSPGPRVVQSGDDGCPYTLCFCASSECSFTCPPEWWNSLRRKMTREEATASVERAWDAWANGNGKEWHDAHAAVYAALTGEKT